MPRKKKIESPAIEVELTNVRVFKREGRYLMTIPPDHSIWSDPGEDAPFCKNAIVRLLPPYFAEDDRIAGVVDLFREAGALKAIIMPRANPPAIVPAVSKVAPSGASPRQVVLAMADEARVSDKAGLRSYLEAVLDEAGA